MRVVVLISFVFLALVAALESDAPVLPAIGYHETYGIPLAKKIQDAEFAFAAEDNGELFDGRIVGGAIAPTFAYPFLGGLIISMTHTPNFSVCGSSLLSANRLITAAHCWWDGRNQAWQFQVVLGSQFLFIGGGTRVTTSQVVMHSQWNPSTFANDVAMIYLPTNVVFNHGVQPVALPTANVQESFSGWWSRASGYGRTSDFAGVSTATQVSHVQLQVIANLQCQTVFGTTFVRYSTICTNGAGGVGICQGDSGGPLVVSQNGRDVLIGVSSFVASTGCQQGHPSAFARVTSFLNWIQGHM